jgi:hypothetical protein
MRNMISQYSFKIIVNHLLLKGNLKKIKMDLIKHYHQNQLKLTARIYHQRVKMGPLLQNYNPVKRRLQK